ncbi:MAG: adenylate/guanylate cyclase domain-containing protein [Chloroflexota bacterium]|nr:adenylate/guanylate cyclase domain-containing protein [Chloroflexota bacterium]
MEPQIQYVKTSDGVNIAYYAIGNGPPYIAMSPRISSNIEDEWKIPSLQAIFRAAASAFTFVKYDMRGCGLSDRDVGEFSLEAMMRDLDAVADRTAPGSFALSCAGTSVPVGVAYAAIHPERVSHLVLWAVLRGASVESPDPLDQLLWLARTDWKLASESWMAAVDSWSNQEDARSYAAMMRRSVAPETFFRHETASNEWDVSELAPRVRARTLVVHPRDHPYYPTEGARSLAAAIPGARLVLSEGNTVLVLGPQALAAMSEFLSDLTGSIPEAMSRVIAGRTAPERAADPPSGTAVILFADIVDSTAITEQLGDAAFREKARELDTAMRAIIREHAGNAIDGKLLGDGVLAVFKSAREAIDAALRCAAAGHAGGLPLHLGIHAGDVIREEDNVYGGAVNIASRISGLSAPGELLVSDTVRSLARTSAVVRFEDRGEHALKGVADAQRVFAVIREP